VTTSSGASPSSAAGRPEHGAAGALVGELFAEHGRMVLGLCRLLLRDAVEAEDAAQQVFLSAHRALLGGSVPREAAAWLAAIARNECRARIRARMRAPLELPELPSDLPDPLASAIRAVDLEAFWAALSVLPRRQRRALVLREVGGLSYGELGRALGVSQSAVESLLFRARQHVRSLLAGANAAAVPLALRDELTRLIPGFDPGSAGLLARVAALPVAVKLATAAAGVGAVATGVAELPRHRAAVDAQPAPPVQPAVKPSQRLALSAPVLISDRPAPAPRASARHEAEPGQREAEHAATERDRSDGEVRKVENQQAGEPGQPAAPEPPQDQPGDQPEFDSSGD
jgi:RNA polymerase sigma-70 factor (ECF subfamily)